MTGIRQKSSIAIYCDLQNVYLIQEVAKDLLLLGKSQGRLIEKKVYYNSQCKNQTSAKDKLEGIGFTCLDVPCPQKNSADNQLIADCLEDVHNNSSLKTVILGSGDGDFVKLVDTLQKLGIKVIVIAQRGNFKQRLKERADEFYLIDELSHLVGSKTQPNTDDVLPRITYEDAIACLLEAIKTALSQHKPTTFPVIDSLMRDNKRFPNYQGVRSIRKSDDNKFSGFSKFINAVVAEGKVQMANQELFLIDEAKLAA